MAAQMNSDAIFFRKRQDFLPIMTSMGVLRDFVVFNGRCIWKFDVIFSSNLCLWRSRLKRHLPTGSWGRLFLKFHYYFG